MCEYKLHTNLAKKKKNPEDKKCKRRHHTIALLKRINMPICILVYIFYLLSFRDIVQVPKGREGHGTQCGVTHYERFQKLELQSLG